MDNWEVQIDKSRETHKHKVATGGIFEEIGKVKYCKPCDMFYYPNK